MIRIREVKVGLDEDFDSIIKRKIAKKINVKENLIKDIRINKKSIDARDKNNIFYVYEIDVLVEGEKEILKKNKNVILTPDERYIINSRKMDDNELRPIIVGSGPSGLFCAYLLAEYGFKPLVIERGEMVEDRIKTVEKFWKSGILNSNSNVQFGEGGAGTFSDGKLNTLIKDKKFRVKKVFEIFVEAGASPEIMYINNPHIGTDKLRDIVKNIRNKIIEMGGEFKYNSCLTDIKVTNGKVSSIVINNKEEVLCDKLVLAIGHSARDTFYMLNDKGVCMTSKPFAVGVRIEHKRDMIDKNQYGKFASKLGASSYKLTYQTSSGRGVYSFCMCPGGYVVNSSSEDGLLVVNGMSYSKRDSDNSNSAIVVTVNQSDFGNGLFDGIKFQEKLESNAYKLGSGNIPIQLYKDFKNNIESNSFIDINPVMKGNFCFSNLNDIFPSFITNSLKEGIDYFDKKIKGFASDGTILSGVESRTSSPIRIIRDDRLMSNIYGIYPCGEGAGYAGGITTSAVDGLKVAESILCK